MRLHCHVACRFEDDGVLRIGSNTGDGRVVRTGDDCRGDGGKQDEYLKRKGNLLGSSTNFIHYAVRGVTGIVGRWTPSPWKIRIVSFHVIVIGLGA